MTDPRVGDVVQINFLDHCRNGSAIECVVVGRVRGVDEMTISTEAWTAIGEDADSDNNEWFDIVKATIATISTFQFCGITEGPLCGKF